MEYQILGPIRILEDGNETFLNARKVQTLLAVLLIRSGQIVSVDQLMNEIWHQSPPRCANASLHVYVSQLRKVISRAGSRDRLLTRSPGYLLRLDRDELDVNEFERRMNRGRKLLKLDRFEEADRELTAALAVWRGRALGELPGDGPIIRGFVAWAEETRLECMEMQIDAQLALGHNRRLIGPLYQMVSEYPLRESFYRHLMVALCQADRQADALGVYRAAWATLNRELGVEPCRALRELHQSILAGELWAGDEGARLAS
jgi:SARP family transcriptional regulator, regulator of embCAB operon